MPNKTLPVTLGLLGVATGIASAFLAAPVAFRSFAAAPCSGEADYQKLASGVFFVLSAATIVLGLGSIFVGIRTRNAVGIVGGLVALAVLVIFTPSIIVERSNEPPGIASIRTIHTAQVVYRDSTGKYGTMDDLIRAGLLDPGFARTMRGYTYILKVSDGDYVITATTAMAGQASCFDYDSAADAVIRYSTDPEKAPPNRAGLPLQ